MSDTHRLLDLIEQAVVEHGGGLGGWTRRTDDALQLFDGRATLRAGVHEDSHPEEGMVHAHVFTTLHEHDDEVLDACLVGAGKTYDAALSQAAVIWITGVAGPIKSFADGEPVCMTCQAGVAGGDISRGYARGDFGLPGLRAYVGPSIYRGVERVGSEIDDTKPWFRYAAESAAPRRVHLAKATIASNRKKGWLRELEVDGHDVAYHDPDWPAGVAPSDGCYLTRFAVFEFPRNSTEIPRRAELERTVTHFAEHFSKYESVDRLKEEMVGEGFDADLVHEAESISTIAFGRTLFERLGVQYASTIVRARRDGRVETDVPLMSIPAYARARAIAARLQQTMSQDDFQALCLYAAESNLILRALEADGKRDLSNLTFLPCVVPDRGASKETVDAAFATLKPLLPVKKKAWWKLW